MQTFGFLNVMLNAAAELRSRHWILTYATDCILLNFSPFVATHPRSMWRFLTRTGVNVGQKLQVGPQPVEVGWISSPLQRNCQLLNTLSK